MSTAAPALIRELFNHRRCPKRDTRPLRKLRAPSISSTSIENEYGDIIVEEYAKREKRLAYEKERILQEAVAGVKRTAKKIANKL